MYQAGQGPVDPGGVPLAGQRGQPVPGVRTDPGGRLKGIEEKYELPAATEDDVWALSDQERRAMGLQPLPGSLEQAIAAMEGSELVAETLGEHVFDFFLRNKKAEWDEYRAHVTRFEMGGICRYESSGQPAPDLVRTGVTDVERTGDNLARLCRGGLRVRSARPRSGR